LPPGRRSVPVRPRPHELRVTSAPATVAALAPRAGPGSDRREREARSWSAVGSLPEANRAPAVHPRSWPDPRCQECSSHDIVTKRLPSTSRSKGPSLADRPDGTLARGRSVDYLMSPHAAYDMSSPAGWRCTLLGLLIRSARATVTIDVPTPPRVSARDQTVVSSI